MRSLVALVFAVVAVSSPICAEAQERVQERVVGSGKTLKISYFMSALPTCETIGTPNVSLISEPQNGRVFTKDGREYSGFPLNDPRSRCNTLKLPATDLFYTSTHGFRGEDTFEVLSVNPMGVPHRARFHIVLQ